MSLLATQRCCSEHATRMAQEYLRCAPTKDRGHDQAHSIRATAGSVVPICCRRPRLRFSNVIVLNLGVKGKTHTHNPGFKMAGGDESKFICLL